MPSTDHAPAPNPASHPQATEILLSNDAFIRAVYREGAESCYVTGFAQPPDKIPAEERGWAWGGGELRNGGKRKISHAIRRGLNTFATISTFRAGADGKVRRTKALHDATWCIVIDDVSVGAEMGPGAKLANNGVLDLVFGLYPSWVLETSPGNTQWGLILREPETRGWVIEQIQDGLIRKGWAEDTKDPGMRGVTRYYRLPEGWNTKTKYQGLVGERGFRHRLLRWEPEIQYTTAEIAEALEVALVEPAFGRRPGSSAAGEGAGAGAGVGAGAGTVTGDDPVLVALAAECLVKGPLAGGAKAGAWDITCPWIDGHTDGDDSGSAWFSPGYKDRSSGERYDQGGYCCHHGHCEDKSARDVRDWLAERGHDVDHVVDLFEVVDEVLPENTSEVTDDGTLNSTATEPELTSSALRDRYQRRLQSARNDAALRSVARDIAGEMRLSALDRLILVPVLQHEWHRLTQARLPVALARQMIQRRGGAGTDMVPGGEGGGGDGGILRGRHRAPPWAQTWVYVERDHQFFDQKTREVLDPVAFDAKYAAEFVAMAAEIGLDGGDAGVDAGGLALGPGGGRPSTWLLCHGLVPIANRLAYAPGAPDLVEIPQHQGKVVVANTYIPPGGAKEYDDWTLEDYEAVGAVQAHWKMMIPDARERALLWAWVRHRAERPDERVNWAVLLVGTTGDGKSSMLDVLRGVCGASNVTTILGVDLEKPFNGFAEGKVVVGVEEVKWQGHSKFDAFNAMKPLITNEYIRIERKGKDIKEAKNHAGWIAFSNHLDGIPLDDEDRRWFVLRMRYTTKAELREGLAAQIGDAQAVSAYWDRYASAVRNHGAAIRRWLLDQEIPAEFQAYGDAPNTEAKDEVKHLTKSEIAHATEEIIAEGHTRFVTPTVLSLAHLGEAVTAQGPFGLNSSVKGVLRRYLTSVGWEQVKDPGVKDKRFRPRLDGDRAEIWAKIGAFPRKPGPETLQKIRETLEKSAGK